MPLGTPPGSLLAILNANPVDLDHLRGGGRMVANVSDFTFTLASYQTIFDLPAVRFRSARPDDPGYVLGTSVITAETFCPSAVLNRGSISSGISSPPSAPSQETCAAAVGSLIIRSTFRPAILPASLVAWR